MSTQNIHFGVPAKRGPQAAPAEGQKLTDLLLWEKEWHQAFQRLRDGWPEWTYQVPVIELDETAEPDDPRRLTVRLESQRTGGWPPEPGLWDALVRARTPEVLRRVCKRWEKWLHPGSGVRVYPQRLAKHAREFLRIRKDKRFPRSLRPSSNEKRIDFFARGMAGIDIGLSPVTAIDRLRRMKHGRKCQCWRCDSKRMKEAELFISKLLSEAEE